jgi:integrase
LAGDGVIAANVAAGVKRPAVSPVGVTRDPGRDHVALVVGWCRTRQAGDYGAVVELMARWALRVGEVTALRGRDVAVDSSGAVVLTIKGKGGRPATVRIPPGDPLAARVLQSVAALGLRTLDAPLWQAQQGGKVTTTKVREVLARACHYLQIPTVTPHQLRVFAITASLDAGHNIDDVSTFARHAHVNTTRRYDRNPQRRVDAVAETVTRTLAH